MKIQPETKAAVAILFYALLAGGVFLSGCVGKNTTGSAYFSSEPSGAEIWIDGSDAGKITPAAVPDLKEGNHTYALKKEGYVISSGTFYVKAGQTTSISKVLPAVSPSELKYRLLENFSNFFYCDPDLYPIEIPGAEEKRALEQFPDIQKNPEEFQTILRHTDLESITDFSTEQKLLIYREHKKLNSVSLDPSGEAYKFRLSISESGTPWSGFFNIEGIIDNNGTITILRKEERTGGCPICLAGNTRIDTPAGSVAVKDLQKGMEVWTADSSGTRIPAIVLKNVSVPVPPGYRIVHLVLDDGRELSASPGHPAADGRKLGTLSPGDALDGAIIVTAERIPYEGTATYDILPSGDTGFYRANGILIRSTLTSQVKR
ncbi:MAG: PEGA domain-containing protein [Candidatus Methanoperedens sp.]|nr:PEGA domain-containing protein [Candidatus Methanoperedens sp.]